MRTPEEWHARFTQQARWTLEIRRALLDGLGLAGAQRGLETGCGSGVIAGAMQRSIPAHIYGIDLRFDFLRLARTNAPGLTLSQADGLALPFATGSFDFSFCHYYLLWVSDPALALREMARVTRPGGVVLALAEPDYGGRIDYPLALAEIGRRQALALRQQGAKTEIGRQLAALLHAAGLVNVQVGVLSGHWGGTFDRQDISTERDVLFADLAGQATPQEIEAYTRLDTAAWQSGERILFIPTFYAWGFVPGLADDHTRPG